MDTIATRLARMGSDALGALRRGIEKESLRVDRNGKLACTPHPPGLGSPLTHPFITTDFSESQLELITGVHTGIAACLNELTAIHQIVYRHIADEVLWCASMPCALPAEEAIPIGRYGHSNIGRAKTVYRVGLSHRYGRRMQTISGIHYNFSVPQAALSALGMEANDAYFALIRNFRRHSWLLLYLLGASPAVCASFVEGRAHDLEPLGAGTLYKPYATSLRMGGLGYQSEAQAALAVSYNSLDVYTEALEAALTTPYPAYEAIGVRSGDEYRQLTTSLLQIENEFYGTIRPKRRIRRGERPLHALRERGVEYVEVRLIDLDPFSPVGISADAMRFLDVFLLHCLLEESPPDGEEELRQISGNQRLVSGRGREPGLVLSRRGAAARLAEWATEVLEACRPIAAALDAHAAGGHSEALAGAIDCLRHPVSLPSARVLEAIERQHKGSYGRFGLAQSLKHAEALRSIDLLPDVEREHARLARESLAAQRSLEAADHLSFEDYRRQYLAPERLRP
jgi:glutamate--cysteine ligase